MSMLYDLAVFGSGFAGYELARSISATGRTVCVIERGTDQPSTLNQQLSVVPYRREPIVSGGPGFGARVPAGFETAPRYIGLGGTSELWSGKWRRLDRLDFARGHGARRWPISAADLDADTSAVETEYGYPAHVRNGI